jgi:hypothetical protein
MKAKEYAIKFDERLKAGNDKIGALTYVLFEFTKEFSELSVKRGQGSEAALLACFRETEQKYHAFCRLVSDEKTEFKPDGWRAYLKAVHPELWDLITVMILRAQP